MPLKSVKAAAEDTRIVLQLSENLRVPPSDLDLGRACSRLVNLRWSIERIVTETGYEAHHIRKCLQLVDSPLEVQQMGEEGTVRPARAIQAVRQHGDAATEVLKQDIEEAKAAGKSVVTRKRATPAARPAPQAPGIDVDAIHAAAQALFDGLIGDPDTGVTLTPVNLAYALGVALYGENDPRVMRFAPRSEAEVAA
jgi:hypothetical protein